jgi:signal transduction histidine kinase/DNA-binding response OmpR family regulator
MQPAEELAKIRQTFAELETQCKHIEGALEKYLHDAGEHTKELGFIFEFLKLTARTGISLDEALQEILDLIPPLWQCPDETCARIILGDKEFKTTNFIVETKWKHAADIIVSGEPAGAFEVFYTEDRPEGYDGVLLWEDKNLVEMVSRGIGLSVERREVDDRLKAYTDDLEIARQAAKEYEASFYNYASRIKTIKSKADESIAALKGFIGNLGREINTHIKTITDATQKFRTTDLTEEQKGFLNNIKVVTDRLNRFAGDVIDYADFEAGRFQQQKTDFSLRELVGSVIDSFAARAHDRGVEAIAFIDPLIPDGVAGDAGRLRQILENLLENALESTAEGEISVWVEIEAWSHLLPIFHFSVADSGPGLPEDQQSDVFAIFARDDDSHGRGDIRTDLGLAISKQLVELMGGEIWVESPANQSDESKPGTRFHFTLWLDIQKSQNYPLISINATGPTTRKALVVDDNATNRLMFRTFLETWGWEPTLVAGGKEALDMLMMAAEKHSFYSLVLLDAHMPEMDGFEVAKRIQEYGWHKKMAIILLSATHNPEEIDGLKQFGMASIVKKPIRQKELYDAIERVAGEKNGIFEISGQETDGERPSMETSAQQALHDGEGGMLLLVAQDRIMQVLAKKLLEKGNYRVAVLSNGSEVIGKAESGEYSAIVIDVLAPAAGSFEAVRTIRERENDGRRRIPIIGISTDESEENRESCLQVGMDDFICTAGGFDGLYEGLGNLIDKYPAEKDSSPSESGEIANIFDREKALTAVGGDYELLFEILDVFEEESDSYLSGIDQAFRNRDIDGLTRAAKTLIGVATSLGAAAVCATAKEILDRGRSNDFENAEWLFDRLKVKIKDLETELTGFERNLDSGFPRKSGHPVKSG